MSGSFGIDISRYEDGVDFAKVKASGINIVYIKATEGTTIINPYLKEQAIGAKAACLKVGFYHFLRAKTIHNAIQQARFFVNTISGLHYDARLVLDLETDESLTRKTLSRVAKAFLVEVKAMTGTIPVIYSFTDFINSYLNYTLAHYPLWLADYNVNQPISNKIWNRWVGWQYTSTGAVPGISGDVDLNAFTRGILLVRPRKNFCKKHKKRNGPKKQTAKTGRVKFSKL
jgi:GH25 family lysozyme M1 (1,4-beta-N-acetylmuramidase)